MTHIELKHMVNCAARDRCAAEVDDGFPVTRRRSQVAREKNEM